MRPLLRLGVPRLVLALMLVPACSSRPGAEATTHLSSGRALARAGQHEPAVRELEAALRLDPGSVEARTSIARIRLDQGRFPEARAAAAHVAGRRPGSPYAHELLGRAALALHDEPAATRELSRALELDPARRYLHVTLGRICERDGRYPEAIESYTSAIDALPGVAEPRIAKARVLLVHVPGASPPSALARAAASRLLDEARARTTVTDAQRAEIGRLSAQVDRLHAELDRPVSGILGVLRSNRAGWESGAPPALGNDSESALGALMGDEIGENFGFWGAPRGTAHVGPPTARGSLSSGAVTPIIQSYERSFRFCYEQALRRAPSLTGGVVVRLSVEPAGWTSSAVVSSSTLGDAAVAACIVESARHLMFPASPGITIVDFPVTFAH